MKKWIFASLLTLACAPVIAAVDVGAVRADPALVPEALAALTKEGDENGNARIIVALTPHAARADVKQALRSALTHEGELVRVVAARAAVMARDPLALPVLFDLCSSRGEDGRCAALAMAVLTTEGADAFLFERMKQEGAARAKAIELLAARGNPMLVTRLCDASLYTERGVSQAAAGAFRACLREAHFAEAMAFVFGSLSAEQREPLVAALGSVVQQLPDQARVVDEVSACAEKVAAEARAGVLGLLAGIQTEKACGVLVRFGKTEDVELRKAVVRTFAKWNSPLALMPLVHSAGNDADAGVKVLALRSALAMMEKPGVASTDEKLKALTVLAEVAERKEERKMLLATLKSLPSAEAAALRLALTERFDIQDNEVPVASVNIGGKEVGTFTSDARVQGGNVYAVNNPIDVSGAADAAPEAVYQSSRFQNMTCRFDSLKPNAPYLLRLHFAELYHQSAGQRICDVIANGVKVLENYDIVERAGKGLKAITETRSVTSDTEGKILVEFKTVRDHVLVNGVELLEEIAAPPAGGAVADKIRVLILSGANNHDWKSTTAALRTTLAANPRFAVSVTETPWAMKPADLAGYDVLISNWNTFGMKPEDVKKHEWNDEMKAAFLAWFTNGGGFFVLHSGSCIFYDWDDFQRLAGGAWGEGTFHPHNQKFTLNIIDKEHPVTKGMTDFETFDEPWQKLTNPNPKRRVLVSGIVSKENKGSGEPEPFVFVTETGKGRNFTLMLGHDAQTILSSLGCKKLILRGTEWAATGAVKE
ncbi:MAG: ThuA domain-containing protein [Kiritimatiellaeota bacterium]|nr:ThuA domain-containing protein [Kiritimatiellota bacterium]